MAVFEDDETRNSLMITYVSWEQVGNAWFWRETCFWCCSRLPDHGDVYNNSKRCSGKFICCNYDVISYMLIFFCKNKPLKTH